MKISMPENPDPRWIENAHLDEGSLGRKARRAGMSTSSFARKNSGAGGKLGRQSRLADTLAKLRGKGASK